MTKQIKLNVVIYGIRIKLKRGEALEDILASYVKLSEPEKDYIRDILR